MEIKINTEYEVLTPDGFKSFYGIKKNVNNYLEITLNNGEKLGVTNKHIFVINNKNVYANQLSVGDKLTGIDVDLEIIGINPINEFTNVFDLIEVDDGNIYYTNNVISHNCAFIGSGDNVVEGDVIRKQELENEIGRAHV